MSSKSVISSCLVCNSCCTSNTGIQVFNIQHNEFTEDLAYLLSKLLNKDIKQDPLSIQLICKKCYNMAKELDDLQNRVLKIKHEMLGSSVEKTEIEDEGEDKATLVEGSENTGEEETDGIANNEDGLPKKILFIPSSDDDSTQVSSEKQLGDLQFELVEIKNSKDIAPSESEEQEKEHEEDMDVDTEANFHSFTDDNILDHSSDVEYETGTTVLTTDDLSKPTIRLTDKNIAVDGGIKVKTEPSAGEEQPQQQILTTVTSSLKPNILKKKVVHKAQQNVTLLTSPPSKPNKFDDAAENVVSKEGEYYTCLMCDPDQTVVRDTKAITAHTKQTHDVRIYICDVCGAVFRKRTQMSAHLDEHVAADEGDFQCEVCNRIFSNLRLFRIHRRMHFPQNKAWECTTCGKKYSSKNLLDEHINTHLGLRPYVCTTCGKDFASKYTFKAHEKTHEVRPRPYKCNQCAKSFLSQQNLTQHERTHLGVKEYACHLCDKTFGSAHNLEVHSIVHTGYKPFVCGVCDKAFARKAEIRDHERTHTGERPYQCEFCGATFSQRSNLQSHKRATHYDDKRYRCIECGKGFKRRRLLDYHVKAVHTGERPFRCEVCEATFVYPEHFKKHRRIHTGEKPYLCEVCGKAFNSRDNRNAHRFVHSDKKLYECLACGAGFMRKPLLYQHMHAQGHLNDTIVVNQPRSDLQIS
ncbi:unnamed protein product [Acanthoscelides obtectus]|uniref:Uncharacterized protein n=1 Tax=Acanthoscelides obtectus TaxID=200917 RepID=A0A9P0Q234_ACAOB|nr:unnamed protein product [Acanthoscelides obtectus]CAK1632794.1 Zinc finger protein 235 [Acanthoscelides obtectus]